MKRTFWLAAVLGATAVPATVLFLRQQQLPQPREDASTVTRENASTVTPLPARNVRVRHEFVTVAMPAAALTFEASSAAPAKPPAAVPAEPVHRTHNARADEPLLTKARRAFLGDGRHRPEPFPRVK